MKDLTLKDKYRSFYFFAATTFLMFYSLSCSFEKPSAPSWETEITIPLVSKVYTMAEMAEDESTINLGSNGMLSFEIEEELQNYYVGDQLELDNFQDEINFEMGAFEIASPGSEFSNVTLVEIYPQSENLDGQNAVVPPINFNTTKTLAPYEDFSFVDIATGSIFVKITNNLAIPLGSPITIEILDNNTNDVIVSTTVLQQILPGASNEFAIDLQGRRLVNDLSVNTSGSSPGSQGSQVLIDKNSAYEVEARIGDLQVSQALARVKSQVVQSLQNVAINDSVVVMDASIEQGAITLSIVDPLPFDYWIIYELVDFITPSGNTMIDSFFVGKNSGVSQQIDLQGFSLQPEAGELGEQTIRVNFTVRTIDTGSDFVLVSGNDVIDANFNLSNVRFSSFSGIIGETTIDITGDEFDFDLPADLDDIFFESARMEFIINNGVNFPARTNINIEGQNESGTTAELSINNFIQPASAPGIPVTSVHVLDQQNSNITQFISIVPSLIRVFGQIELGNETWVGTVTKNDFINGTVRISAPLALKFGAQNFDTETRKFEIDEDVRNDIINDLSSGAFYAELSNHLPIGASVELFFSEDSSTVFDAPILQIGPLSSAAATVDASGYVESALASEITFALNEEEMQTFVRSPLFVAVRVSLDGTDEQVVRFRGSDYIDLKSFARVKVKVNQD